MNEITGKIIYSLKWKRIKLISRFTTLAMKISMQMWNIRYGRRIRFYGFTIFTRFPDSKLMIGNNCIFRSNNSNLSGVYSKCIISTCAPKAELVIGNNCGLSSTIIGAAEKIVIGNDVLIGANSFITDYDWHNIDPGKRNEKVCDSNPVYIGENVWIGRNCCILKGVTIGSNSVIGAQSVVTKTIPENVIAAGNPCVVIKSIK